MLVRSSFRDTISKVKKQFQHDEKIHLIKSDSIDNLFNETNQKRSSSHTVISNGRFFLTRHHSRHTG
jgi:hypothetical protein